MKKITLKSLKNTCKCFYDNRLRQNDCKSILISRVVMRRDDKNDAWKRACVFCRFDFFETAFNRKNLIGIYQKP